jgi:uncharacterized protein (DUF58 family)
LYSEIRQIKECCKNKSTDAHATTDEQRCQREVAEKFVAEKQLVSATLRQYGILSLLTSPQELTVDVINRYLAVRAS